MSEWTQDQISAAKDYFASNPTAENIYQTAQKLNLSSSDVADIWSKATGGDYQTGLGAVQSWLGSSNLSLSGDSPSTVTGGTSATIADSGDVQGALAMANQPLADYESRTSNVLTDDGGVSRNTGALTSVESVQDRFTPDQYQAAGQFFTQNLSNPTAISELASELNLTDAEILKAVQTVDPKITQEQVRDFMDGIRTGASEVTESASRGLVTDYEGTQYDSGVILNLASQIASNFDASRSTGGVFGTKGESVGFDYGEASRLLGKDPSTFDQVILDMARELARQGVTDISQLKTGSYTSPDMELESGYRPGETTTQVFSGDKLLGSPVYGGGNWFGATYTGKGGTGYNVEIDPNTGQPKFYTSFIDTSDRDVLNAALQFASFVPALSPFAKLAQGAIAIEQGNPLGAVTSFLGAAPGLGINLPPGVSEVTKYVNAANAISKGDILGAAATLTGSSDLRTAATAVNAIRAIESGDPFAIFGAAQTLTGLVNAGVSTGGSSSVSLAGGNEAEIRAFQDAINAGMSSDEAMAVARELSGSATSIPVTGGTSVTGTDLGVLKPEDVGTTKTEGTTAGSGLVEAGSGVVGGAKPDTVQDRISGAKTFGEAFAAAREELGPGKTFTWQGKDYSTATFAERPDLTGTSVVPGAASTTAGGGRGSYAGFDPNAAAAAFNTELQLNTQRATEAATSTSIWQRATDWLQSTMKMSSEAANDYLRNNPDSPFTQSVSTAMEAAGELQRNVAGGTALLLGNKPVADAFIKGGDEMIKFGQSIGSGPQDSENWKTTVGLIDAADGFEKLGVLAGRIMDGTSGLGRQVVVELRQELPALFLGGGSTMGILAASGAIDTADTAGNAAIEAFDQSVKAGKDLDSALSDARKAGAAAGAAEAAIQLTLGKLADVAIGKFDNLLTKGVTRTTGEGVTEGGQEAGASAAVDLALGRDININKALTEGVVGAAVGKGTATATTPVTTAQDAGTQISSVSSTVSGQITSGADPANVVSTTISSTAGSGVQTVVNTVEGTVSGAITSGADVGQVIDSAITTSASSGTDLGVTAGAAISGAISSGADIDSVVNAVTTSAANSGQNIDVQVDGNVITINNATTNSTTTVNSGVSTTVNNNTNVTTQVDSNTNTTTQTAVDTNTNVTTQTSINATTNVTTQTTTDANTNTQTTVTTDPNTNTQTTVTTNTTTGEIIDEKVTEVPTDWTPPVIDTPVVDTPVVETPTVVPDGGTPKTPPTKTPPKPPVVPPKAGGDRRLMSPMVGGLPSFLDPVFLKSRETQRKLDPLAEVKKAQEELEKTVMMQNMDPRLMAILQQQAPQEQPSMEKDIGALAQVLSGETPAPDKYYAYGSEDSIDDILGSRTYKEGGYVAPLMMKDGGDMPLPLMSKSGGALSQYSGRENFKEGKHVAGDGDGQSDDIPAWLADGEFVFPADVVSALGNGSTKAGTDKLYEMMHSIRERARSSGPKDLPPPALKSPLDYLKSSKRSAK